MHNYKHSTSAVNLLKLKLSETKYREKKNNQRKNQTKKESVLNKTKFRKTQGNRCFLLKTENWNVQSITGARNH